MSTLNQINSESTRIGYDEGCSKRQGLGSKVSNASNWQDLPLEILEMVAKHLQEDPIDLKSFFEISPLTKCSVLNVIHLQAIKELQVLSNLNTSEAKQSSSAIDFYVDFLANIQHPNFELRKDGVKIDDSKLQKLQQALTALSTIQVAERLINFKQECYQEISKEEASIERLVNKYTSFKNAVVLDALKLIFDHSVNPRSTKSWAVRLAAQKGHLVVVQALLAGGEISESDIGWAFTLAAQNGHLVVVQALLANGEISKEDRGYIVRAAAYNGHLEVVKALLADGEIFDDNRGWAVESAAKQGHLAVVELLLSDGGISKTDRGWALKSAASGGHLEVAQLLLGNGKISENDRGEAINLALEGGHQSVADYLRKNQDSSCSVM